MVNEKYLKINGKKGKKIDSCFMSSKDFKKDIMSLDSETELTNWYNGIKKATETVVKNNRKLLKNQLRTVTKFEGKKGFEDLVATAQNKADKLTESIEDMTKENSWQNIMLENITNKIGELLEEEGEE